MPRPIVSVKNVIRGVKIINYLSDDSVLIKEIYPDDIVTNLYYLKKDRNVAITGKFKKANFFFKKFNGYLNGNDESNLTSDAVVTSFVIDASSEYNSNLVEIPSQDLVKYGTEEDCIKSQIVPAVKVEFKVTLDDGTTNSIELKEGMNLFGTTVLFEGKEKTDNFNLLGFIYSPISSQKNIDVTGIILRGKDRTMNILFKAIKYIGDGGIVIEDTSVLSEVIESETSSEKLIGITIPSVKTCSCPLVIDGKTVVIEGGCSNISANTGMRASSDIDNTETVFESVLSCINGADVSINGVTLTASAFIKLSQAKSLELINCKFTKLSPYDEKSNLIVCDSYEESPTKLVIENCYFGENLIYDISSFYDLFELRIKLADGSRIVNNYFEKTSCVNNIMSLYDIEDNATITIENNTFEYSNPAICIEFNGEPKDVTVNISNNKYLESNETNQGLLAIQLDSETISMNGVTINMDKNIKPSGDRQVVYLSTNSDVKFTDEMKPKIYVDRVLQIM